MSLFAADEPHPWLRRTLCCCLALFAAVSAPFASALIREVDAGRIPTLGKDEALLVIGVDTSHPLDEVRIERDGFSINAGKLKQPPAGRSMQLYAVPAGRYRWDRVRVFSALYRLDDDEEFYFDVKPGVINYPGDLVVRPHGWNRATLHIANRGLRAMDWLDAQHPALVASIPFAYSGHYGDPFPQAYRAAVSASAHKQSADAVLPIPDPGRLPISINRLWQPQRIRLVDLNPRGDLLAEVVVEEDRTWAVDIFDLRGHRTSAESVVPGETPRRVLESPSAIVALDWSGDSNLLVSIGTGRQRNVFVLQVQDQADGTRKYERLQVPRLGRVVSTLPGTPDAILYSTESHLGLHVHRLDISSQQALNQEKFRPKAALDRGFGDDVAWYADAAGALRVALVHGDDGLRFYHGGDGRFEPGPLLEDLHGFSPHALSADGTRLYGVTEEDRAQDELVAVDVATGKSMETLFRREGRDVIAPVLDETRKLVGASYIEHGQYVIEYFDSADAQIDRRLQDAFPGRSVWLLDRNAASDRFIVSVGGSDQPERLHSFDLASGRTTLLDDTRPWLAKASFAPSHLVRTRSSDGLDIEAYLTLPAAAANGKIPLVLMPHGGPIGVRDVIAFDPEVQLIAALGYAVLQVNFRGSYGFGRAFREAGHGGLGTAIEDDIDAALQAALAAFPLDPQRMCVLGSSYGGYSALVAGVRWPGRFRCAVSMSGVTDLMLQFTASDTARSAEGRKGLEEIIGDPATGQAAIVASSPLYQVDKLTLPVMLVHGTEDLRVDLEHSLRLRRLLALAGRPPVLIELEGEAHGIDDPGLRVAAWRGVAGFLRTHLDTPSPATP